MWFRLIPPRYESAPLAALVGDDGKLYWRISDIARHLGQSDSNADYCMVLGRDVVKGDLNEPTAHARLCTTPHALRELLLGDLDSAHWFEKSLMEGKCLVIGDLLKDTCAKSPMLLTGGCYTPQSIREWISQFKRRVLESRSLDVTVLEENRESENETLMEALRKF